MKRKVITVLAVVAFIAAGVWLMGLAIRAAGYALLFLLSI